MEKLKGLPLGRQLVLGAGVLLLIDTFLAWQKVSFSIAGVTSASVSANAWHGFWGVVLGLATIAILLWVGAKAFGVALPDTVPDGLATLGLGALILVCAVVKTLHDSYSAWGSYVGIVLALLVAAGAWLVFQESGEALPRVAGGSAGGPSGRGSSDTTPTDNPPPAGSDAV